MNIKLIGKSILLTSMLMIIQPAAAKEQATGQNIVEFSAYDGVIFLKLSKEIGNVDNCTHPSSTRLVAIDTDGENGKYMYSAALSAYMSAKRVSLGLNGCSRHKVPKVYRVQMY